MCLQETIYDAQIGYDFPPGSFLSGLSLSTFRART